MLKIQIGLAVTALVLALPFTAHAQSTALKGTVVLRVDNRDGSQATVSLNTPLASEAQAQALAQDNSKFNAVPNDGRSELDRDGGAPSYYFYRRPYAGGGYGYSPYARNPYAVNPYAVNPYAVNPYATYTYNPYYYAPTVAPSAIYPAYSYYGSTYSPYYVYNTNPYTYYYYGYGW